MGTKIIDGFKLHWMEVEFYEKGTMQNSYSWPYWSKDIEEFGDTTDKIYWTRTGKQEFISGNKEAAFKLKMTPSWNVKEFNQDMWHKNADLLEAEIVKAKCADPIPYETDTGELYIVDVFADDKRLEPIFKVEYNDEPNYGDPLYGPLLVPSSAGKYRVEQKWEPISGKGFDTGEIITAEDIWDRVRDESGA
jgi:hypothetical protein